MTAPDQVVDGEQFHRGVEPPVYAGELGDVIIKRAAQMAVVRYDPCHPNPAAQGDLAGHGQTLTRWVFSEDDNKAEGLSQTPFNLFVDFRLDPHAALGLHPHHDKEEIYYVLEGSVVLTVESHGQRHEYLLNSGDAHLIRLGQSHAACAGAEGARLIGVCVCPR